jgi:hypothetical protein
MHNYICATEYQWHPLTSFARQSPGVRVIVLVMQGFDLHVLPMPRNGVAVCVFEEPGRKLWQPPGVDCKDLPHVLLGRKNQIVMQSPFWLVVEEAGAWMDVHWLLLHLHVQHSCQAQHHKESMAKAA